MGQYYKICFKNNGEIHTNNRKYGDGHEYEMAKLMEHSYIHNWLMDSVAKFIHKNPTNLLWCGDYTEENNEVENATGGDVSYDDIWGEEEKMKNRFIFPLCKRFGYKNRYFVNHTKKEYISFDKYFEKIGDEDLIINPISLLTALGNGRGGGDYYGDYPNTDKVGYWKWDLISIENKIPEGYTELDIYFKEEELKNEEDSKETVDKD